MQDLFSSQEAALSPLADRMRPRTLDEFIGQGHIVGPGRLLRRAIEADRMTSSIFYGPPGCGKTTLASIIAGTTHSAFVQLNAVTSGVADVRQVIKEAQDRRSLYGQATYLLLDECHRWSKSQSDSILPAIERGVVRFIGSTTENPLVSMTPAIVSRCRIFQFYLLSEADVMLAMRRALAESETGVIAEFKRRSPSKGWLHEDAKVEAVVPAYETGGASACSVLTDGEFFGGTLEDLKQARRLVRLPLLRKDFVVDEYQLYQARAAGAAAVLLIAAVLSPDECRRFARTAHELELEVLLEVHTPSELSRLNGYVDMLGVNNRDLGTFHTDVENSFRMADLLRREVGGGSGPLPVSESGISDPETVVRLREAGFRGFLMGEAFMKSGDPGRALAEFIARLKEARP